jgi:NAD(P)-dependent dehydrogenase (short-subunit alcohol dehydrogenase family)
MEPAMKEHPVAVVTGAGRGIGRAVALALAQDGYKVALLARSREQLESVAREITQLTKPARSLEPEIHVVDIADFEATRKIGESIMSRWGCVDVLVNNAGQWLAGALDVSDEQFDRLLAVNVAGSLALIQVIAAAMKKQGSGHIINVASRSGKVGFAQEGAYCASKFALVGLSESLYRELSPLGIKVTALCPSWTNTDMAQEANTPLPVEEMIQPEDLAKTVRWLLALSPATCVKEVLIECRQNIA